MPPVAARAPALGSAHRGRRPPLRGHLALRGRPHPARLRPVRRRDLPARRRARASAIDESPGDYYLVVSALAPYKRVDLAVEAANRLGAGSSSWGRAPRSGGFAPSPGPPSSCSAGATTHDVAELYARCRALLFPPLEDFGITPLEAMAAGRPVHRVRARAAPRRRWCRPGGAEPPTGLFFARQTVEDVIDAIRALRGGRRPLRAEGSSGAGPRPSTARSSRSASSGICARRLEERPPVLKAHSQLLEHLMLAGDLAARRRVLAPRLLSSGSTCWARRSGAGLAAAVSPTC